MNKMAPSPRRERSSASVAGRGLISNPYCLGMGQPARDRILLKINIFRHLLMLLPQLGVTGHEAD